MQLSLSSLVWHFYYFFNYLGFLDFFGFLKLRLIELPPLELRLPHEALSPDKLLIIVRTLASILEIHESLNGNQPSPLLIAIPRAKVEHVLLGSQLEPCGDHVFVLS